MAENEKQNPSNEEKNDTKEVKEKTNEEKTEEVNLLEKKEEVPPEDKIEETQKEKKEEKAEKDNKNEETKKEEKKEEKKEKEKEEKKEEEKEDENDDDEKKLKKAINELPTESIKAKSIILYNLNEDIKNQYLDKYKSEKLSIELKELDNFLNYLNKIREIINASNNEKEKISSLILTENQEKYSIKETEEEKDEFIPINKFWSISLINAKFFEISEKDKKVLEHLIDMKYIPLTYPSFKVEFIFEENEFLEEKIIYKTYHFQENEKDIIEKSEGCEIKWKNDENNPTIKTVVKRNKKMKEFVTKSAKSFFNIFDNKDKDNLNKELVEANFFRNDFFQNMLEYYLNIMEINYKEEVDDEDEKD